jgi:hypothetical protein
MADQKSKLLNKISPLIEGQVPDFVQSDHPVFVKFLKQYYQFMEAGQITYTATVDYVTLETTTVAYVLEEDGDRVVIESGSNGTTGKFTNNETITGATVKYLFPLNKNLLQGKKLQVVLLVRLEFLMSIVPTLYRTYNNF